MFCLSGRMDERIPIHRKYKLLVTESMKVYVIGHRHMHLILWEFKRSFFLTYFFLSMVPQVIFFFCLRNLILCSTLGFAEILFGNPFKTMIIFLCYIRPLDFCFLFAYTLVIKWISTILYYVLFYLRNRTREVENPSKSNLYQGIGTASRLCGF